MVVQIPDGAGENGSLADEGGDVVGRGAGVDLELAWEGAWGGGGGAQGVGHQAALPTLGLVVEVNAGFQPVLLENPDGGFFYPIARGKAGEAEDPKQGLLHLRTTH